ncbi:aldolase/citrate lyase family protein [Lichenibacterium dinghuense]|uniref:aldolase/citrate lyase family protein n=1 Tax=Lichenibacterium dinghuense TaxID=2895977 RepID=UPI001F00B15F|nr:aldolase/citrate lyase family protein [Lichenibacterium sp. 6Y81]
MNLPVNRFKRAIREGRQQIGLWCTIPGGTVAEVLAGAGYDWIVFDTEHTPGDPASVMGQLQAAAPYPVSAVVRPAGNDTVEIKRYLDVGAQTLLIPYVQDAEEARAAAAAVRYAPAGLRGVSGWTRATRYGRVPDYARRAADEICLLVQVETAEALERIDAIAAVDGVDGLFIGPADLAASMGHAGDPMHPEVIAAVEGAIGRIRAAGKPAGILTLDAAFAARCMALGTVFTAVGTDGGILSRGADALRASFPA